MPPFRHGGEHPAAAIAPHDAAGVLTNTDNPVLDGCAHDVVVPGPLPSPKHAVQTTHSSPEYGNVSAPLWRLHGSQHGHADIVVVLGTNVLMG